MKRFLTTIFFIAVIVFLFYQARIALGLSGFPSWSGLKTQILTKYFPCKEPLPYTLGSFATEFSLSPADFTDALAQAEAVWEKPSGLDLFVYKPDDDAVGTLKVNLVYDYREQATKKLAALGISVKDTRASYDALKAKLTDIKGDYDKEKAAFDKDAAAFSAKKADYDKQVDYWNARGGAPKDDYDKLEAEGKELESQSKGLSQKEAHLNATIDEVNSLIVSINGIAKNLNLSVEQYNTVNVSRGDSFEEGVYTSDGTNREIDIYEFSSKEKLIRVLAHEFGHALGLEHVDDPKAIMYKLNEGNTTVPDDTDLAALTTLCRTK